MGKALLIILTGFIATLGSLGYNFHKASSESEIINTTTYENYMVRNAAISAAQIAISQLSRNFTWRAGYDSVQFSDAHYSVSILDSDDDSTLTENQVRITAIANYHDLSDSIVIMLHKPSFSKYNIFSNKRPSNMYFITGDTLFGPIHTNTRWNMSGFPVFYGKVSSVETYYQTYGTTNPIFYGETLFGSPAIDFPLVTDMANYFRSAATNGGDRYELTSTKHLWLTFYSDGSYYYEVKDGLSTISTGTKLISNINGMIFADGGTLHVKGTVHGQVTISCTGRIYVEDDLKYATDPRLDPSTTDLVGLIALEKIMLKDNLPNRSNLEIHGSLMAFNLGIRAENYNSGSPRGTLTILGGYIVEEEEPTGTFYLSGGLPIVKTGYIKKYYYDERLLEISPPFFPIIQQPEVLSWKE